MMVVVRNVEMIVSNVHNYHIVMLVQLDSTVTREVYYYTIL